MAKVAELSSFLAPNANLGEELHHPATSEFLTSNITCSEIGHSVSHGSWDLEHLKIMETVQILSRVTLDFEHNTNRLVINHASLETNRQSTTSVIFI